MSDAFAWTVFGTMTAILVAVVAMLGVALFRLTDRIDGIIAILGGRIDDIASTLSGRIDELSGALSARIDNLDTRMAGLATMAIAQGDRLDKRLEAL